MKKSREILIIGDAWDTLDHERDSTLHLCRTARKEFGLKTYWALPSEIYREHGILKSRITNELSDQGLKPVEEAPKHLSSFHSVHWRVDPPVLIGTMRLWSLIASATSKNKICLVNAPEALLKWNEKFAPVAFSDYAITGLVADSEEVWREFFEQNKGKRLIAKPAAEAASRGVQFLPPTWLEAREALRAMRRLYGSFLVIQEFDENITTDGETRIFIVNSEIVGAINKTPKPNHQIMNLDLSEEAKPTLALCEPDGEQRRRALEVAADLAKDGVYIATIDFIGDRILEINVTSPGLINWIDAKLTGKDRIAYKYWNGLLSS